METIFLRTSNFHRLVGSAASYVISDTETRELNDLDFSFYVMTEQRFSDILSIQEQALADIVYQQTNSVMPLKEVYDLFFLDSLKVDSEKECWSLVNFGRKGHRVCSLIITRFTTLDDRY